MNKFFTAVLCFLGFANGVSAQENAGVYLHSKSQLTVELLSEYAVGAKVVQIDSDDGSSFKITWTDTEVNINTRKIWADKEVQIDGITNWINSMPNSDAVITEKFLSEIKSAQDLLGCTIFPDYDSENKVVDLLLKIATLHNGYIFTHQSFYDGSGTKIAGAKEAPSRM